LLKLKEATRKREIAMSPAEEWERFTNRELQNQGFSLCEIKLRIKNELFNVSFNFFSFQIEINLQVHLIETQIKDLHLLGY